MRQRSRRETGLRDLDEESDAVEQDEGQLRAGGRSVLRVVKQPVSLATPVGEGEDDCLGDFIEDTRVLAPADAVTSRKLREQTRLALASLTRREEQVLRLCFGVGQSTDYTLEEVGRRFAVTRERIRQIEARALRKLRRPQRPLAGARGATTKGSTSGP